MIRRWATPRSKYQQAVRSNKREIKRVGSIDIQMGFLSMIPAGIPSMFFREVKA
jgi:hypothetical protein